MGQTRELVLASSSRYRRALLRRLPLRFRSASPAIDEAPLAAERPAETAWRLSLAKARAVASRFPDALVIGSDQVAALGDERLDKPGNHANALRQLRLLSGKAADFHTAVTLLDARSGEARTHVVPCRVVFRSFDERQIETYLRIEQPFDCAGHQGDGKISRHHRQCGQSSGGGRRSGHGFCQLQTGRRLLVAGCVAIQ